MSVEPNFVCPACGTVSRLPEDVANGYCGRCHAFTGDEVRVRQMVELLADKACTECGAHAYWIDMRETMIAKPLGSFSLPGNQVKFSAMLKPWPWIVCGNCGFEERGKAG
jgi:ribosomal protein S27AE